ncbi:MAG TPA: four helix bundle protein [Ignavibacteriales bacterium]|nr:four helix bundle protein [Candidatus Woesearchaeota archaeon]HAB52599.1 four helix bundle protein [Ignavibacteriales bacterium]
MIKSYEDLTVWKEAYALVLTIYKLTQKFPSTELYGLTSQLRRASVSIVANIAEGKGKQYRKEFIHFLFISKGSLEETKVYLKLAKDFSYITQEEFNELESRYNKIGKMLSALINSLKNNEVNNASTQHLEPRT